MRRKRATVIIFFLLAGLIGAIVLSLLRQRCQYALNRALIAVLVKGDDGQAIRLVNEGADPNTRYKGEQMDIAYLERLIPGLTAMGVEFAPGLTDAEIDRVEQKYRFRFPPDLRLLLQYALPVSKGFPHWRDDPEDEIMARLEWPLEGMCFDVECNEFWLAEWGEKPRYLSEACVVVKKAVRKAPKLIPILGHRYLPDEPNLPGNPVLSVWQTDIIHYGYDLADYFHNEFWRSGGEEHRKQQGLPELARPPWAADSPRPIRFWDDVMVWHWRDMLDPQTLQNRS